MKKAFIINVALSMTAAIFLVSCTDTSEPDPKLEVQRNTDSSYYSVHFNDTGDLPVSRSSSSMKIEHSSSSSKNEKSSVEFEDTDGHSSSKVSSTSSSRFASSSGQTSSQSSGSGTSTKTTITYYYDDDGEHLIDTEIDTDTDLQNETVATNEKTTSDTSASSGKENDSSSDISDNSENSTDTETITDTEPIQQISTGEFTENDLVFNYKETAISYRMNIDDILSELDSDELKHIENIPNEDNPDFEKRIYNFEHFSIEAYPSDDGSVYIVSGVQIYDDSVYTAKGVHVGMSVDEAISAYGNNVMIVGEEYRYYIGAQYMYLFIQNDIIANIGFGYDNELADSDQ